MNAPMETVWEAAPAASPVLAQPHLASFHLLETEPAAMFAVRPEDAVDASLREMGVRLKWLRQRFGVEEISDPSEADEDLD
jgi:hypothetical protein